MNCKYCGAELQNENAKFCPKCGKSDPIPEEPKAAVATAVKTGVQAVACKVWPEWLLEEKPLGKGSYGTVYKAVRRDSNVESYAAIKVISIPTDSAELDSLRSEGLTMDDTKTYLQQVVKDFVSEIQLMESMKGVQNIVSVEDYKVVEKTGEIGWDIYIRMELLTPFSAYMSGKALTEDEVIKIGCDICSALEICDKRKIIHRDIKPENIFINDFGHFKLGDFGIARKMENVTGGLSQKGTFNYMAPEVSNSGIYDARVDTYSLGIVLYRLLNGNRLPFLTTEQQVLNPNERRLAVERRIRGEKLPAPCNASKEMADVILRACEYDPAKRFPSATEMKEALQQVKNGTYVLLPPVDLDKTTAVRRATGAAPADIDKTTSVRRAPAAPQEKQNKKPVTQKADAPRKKSKAPLIILLILLLAALIGAGVFFGLPLLEGGNDTNQSDDKIQEIIDDAEKLAKKDKYQEALDVINEGLEDYPKSNKLKKKAEEYEKALKEQDESTGGEDPTEPETEPEPTQPPDGIYHDPDIAKAMVGTWYTELDQTDYMNQCLHAGLKQGGLPEEYLDYLMIDEFYTEEIVEFTADGKMIITQSTNAAAEAMLPDLTGDMRDLLAAMGQTEEEFENRNDMTLEEYVQASFGAAGQESRDTLYFKVDGDYIYYSTDGEFSKDSRMGYSLDGKDDLEINGAYYTRS